MYHKVRAYSLIHPLGITANEIFNAIQAGATSLKAINKPYISHPIYAALFSDNQNKWINETCPHPLWTRFEKLLWIAAQNALDTARLSAQSNNVLFVVATTKGSIERINTCNPLDLNIADSVTKVVKSLGNKNQPIIISNACISGLSAIITAAKYLSTNKYKYTVIIGADTIGDFILSGFNSLFALSNKICTPFDESRNGINLGEGAAAIVLEQSNTNELDNVYYAGGAITNDANHISGPSRTGEELGYAINESLKQAKLNTVDFISAHGTATIFNDEMESKAFGLTQLADKPIHSLKPHLGHTLGAAGIIESVICIEMLKQGILIPSLGYNNQGTTIKLNIQTQIEHKPLRSFVKTMSGFGGCNAAACFVKL